MSSLDILLNHSARQSPTDSTDKLAPDILAVSSGYQHVEDYVDDRGISGEQDRTRMMTIRP